MTRLNSNSPPNESIILPTCFCLKIALKGGVVGPVNAQLERDVGRGMCCPAMDWRPAPGLPSCPLSNGPAPRNLPSISGVSNERMKQLEETKESAA